MSCNKVTSVQNSQTIAYLMPVAHHNIPSIQKTQYVYAIKRDGFLGEILLPLNRMKEMDSHKAIYEKEVKKYEGREKLMHTSISVLNCLWNDVVFFCPVHPHLIYEELQKVGYVMPELSFFQIPIELIADKQSTYWLFPPEVIDETNTLLFEILPPDQFREIKQETYVELDNIPDRTITYYRKEFKATSPDKLPLLFMHIPHLFCRDSISIDNKCISIIKWSEL